MFQTAGIPMKIGVILYNFCYLILFDGYPD